MCLMYSLDSDQARPYVGPDLGPNCLQRLSADNWRWEIVYSFFASSNFYCLLINVAKKCGPTLGPDRM